LNYILYVLLIAVILGIIALIDRLWKRISPKQDTVACTVRQPRQATVLGLLFSLLGVVCLLFVPIREEPLLWSGGLIALLIGAYVLASALRFEIVCKDDGFTYRTLTKPTRYFAYADITGQRAFTAKSGLNVTLYIKDTDIPLNGSMQGVSAFLETAFQGRCRSLGIDPDSVATDPDNLLYFPEAD